MNGCNVVRTDVVGGDRLWERAARSIPGGVNSNVRLETATRFFERAAGAWLWDTEGKEYVDYALGQGPMFLGHANQTVNEAVASACTQGMVFGAQHPLEVEAAEAVLGSVGWADRVRLGVSGSEAVQAVMRVARAVTGRARIVRFIGHYHGWLDNVLIPLDATTARPASAGQEAGSLSGSVVLPWDDIDALEALLGEGPHDVAAVIMEPVMLNSGAAEPSPGYLASVRELCTARGIALVFDEVITGFRVARGGAAERYGVIPDLATYGKAMAGGWPVAAFAGTARFMDVLSDGRVNHSGTFNGSVMACAAVVATLDLLAKEPPYEAVSAYGTEMMGHLGSLAQSFGIALSVKGLPMAFVASLEPSPGQVGYGLTRKAMAAQLHQALADAGIWTTTRGLWFISAAHGRTEKEETLSRAAKAFDELRERLEGSEG